LTGNNKACTAALLVLALLTSFAACGLPTGRPFYAPPSDNTSAPGRLTGVGVSPKSAQPYDIIDFFKKARQAGNALVWYGDWKEFEYARGFPTLLVEQAYLNDLTVIIAVTAFNQSGGKLLRNLDDKTQQKYMAGAANFASKYRPHYLGLGIDSDALYTRSPADFDKFVGLFGRTYDTVKAVSSGTKIFTVFQLEKMNGLNGGLYGGANDPSKNLWFLLDKFPKADLIAFNSYPGMIYKSPFEIPTDYFTSIKVHTARPLAISGTGWQSEEGAAGWPGNETQQAEYAQAFSGLTRDLNPEFTVWSYLYDPTALAEPFNSMGLLRTDGSPRPAWLEWSSVK
jgi:predicted small lipoprotein YifL